MIILFSDIISKAINLFDDPDIRWLYANDPAGCMQFMRPYVLTAKDLFSYPTAIADRLSVYTDGEGKTEEIDGENTDTYVLSTTPTADAVFSYKIGKEFVQGTYDRSTNSVTFPREVTENETCTVTWYYAGAFTGNFSNMFRSDFPVAPIIEKIKNILVYGTLSAWGENEKNRALEIRNLFSDSDLGFYSPASSAKAKVDWHNQMNRDMNTLVVELSWRFMSTPQGGSRFGK